MISELGAGNELQDLEVGVYSGENEVEESKKDFEFDPEEKLRVQSSPHSYKCQICRENDPPCGKFSLPCSHGFCVECLTGYVTSKIVDGIVSPKCCHVEEKEASSSSQEVMDKIIICNEDIPPSIIAVLLEKDAVTLEKYARYKYIRENKNARQCPFCTIFNAGTPDVTPRITCSDCKREYCYFHSNAHDFSAFPTCAEYEASVAEEQKETLELIHTTSKNCPGCGMPVMKSGGCNHMKCQCGVAFCWLCGKQVDDSLFPSHFQWWNPSKCSNLQLDDAIEPTMGRRCCARLIGMVQLIVLGPITLVSTLASSLLCFSCIVVKLQNDPTFSLICGRNSLFSSCMSAWGMIWMFLLIILPLGIALGSVVFVALGLALIVTYPCYAAMRLSRKEYPWPDAVTRAAGRLYKCCGRCCCGCCGERNSRAACYVVTDAEERRSSEDSNRDEEALRQAVQQFRTAAHEEVGEHASVSSAAVTTSDLAVVMAAELGVDIETGHRRDSRELSEVCAAMVLTES